MRTICFRFLIWLFFAGTVFLSSSHFVDSCNTPQRYSAWLMVSLLMCRCCFGLGPRILSDLLFWRSIALVVVALAVTGLMQRAGVVPSASRFAVHGMFDNPAGYAAVLTISLPLFWFLLRSDTGAMRLLSFVAMLIVLSGIVVSGSRTGMATASLGILSVSTRRMNVLFSSRSSFKWLMSLFYILIFSIFLYYLYRMNEASVQGRAFIWRVSWMMWKDTPWFGHGPASFRASYMTYQARYFESHPASKFAQLADNIKHPFNEYIVLAVEYGVCGILLCMGGLALSLFFLYRRRLQFSDMPWQSLLLFSIFSLCSYPTHYAAVWCLLLLFLHPVFPIFVEWIQKYRLIPYVRMLFVALSVFILVCVLKDGVAAYRWKKMYDQMWELSPRQLVATYKHLEPSLRHNPLFLYNYGAVLNLYGHYQESLNVLLRCCTQLNDYDVQLLLADNYEMLNCYHEAEACYEQALNMIPCRFWPLYRLFLLHQAAGNQKLALGDAKRIEEKAVKVPSTLVTRIKDEAAAFLSGYACGEEKDLTESAP